MGIYKREYGKKGKPVWYYQFRHEKLKYTEAGFATEKEAKEAEQRELRRLNSKHNRPVSDKKLLLKDFLPKFLENRKVTKSAETSIREERRSRPILKVFGDKLLSQITAGDIHDYVLKRTNDDELCNRSVNLELTLLRSIFSLAIDYGITDQNPSSKVKNLKEVHHDKWIPSLKEFEEFVEAAKNTASASVFVPWLLFRAYTGTRPKESFFVEWKDIDFERNKIRIRPKEGNPLKNSSSNRIIPIFPALRTILLDWKAKWDETFDKRHMRHPDLPARPHDWVFFNPHDQDAKALSFLRCFAQARKETGLADITSYTFRHFFISHCVMSGMDYAAIKVISGHTSSRMIEKVYEHLRPSYVSDQMQKLTFSSAPNSTPAPVPAPTAVPVDCPAA